MHKSLNFLVVHLLLALIKETNEKPIIKPCALSGAFVNFIQGSYLSKYQERIELHKWSLFHDCE